ncbi:unnamed protein product [Rotaria magnacalcarata]|uniref:Uncharacterized protein n=2 Tax=Rotaria magnacalcarata TaxID=392030 RepID=A0A816XJ40_9BILA|nr:unnamed protein product [Rotaria magnacalcarata]CAF1532928.1 unnamed protein product [Rotaria magnacalcarata]CAF2048845.1 unnamed protein product [Rotaria magnacalcarata]CAF2117716.1 unnamed protein product [Rotaria magnacalcarata]CAF2146043.1 unnamed protein product [Rotaria magnacalcarata]
MYVTKYSILLILVIFSLVLFCYTNADSSEQQDHLIESSDEEYGDVGDLYHGASIYPFLINQRASLRPFAGKRASLRPFGRRASLRPLGKRASLRPFGKRASLRPQSYVGKRKQRSIIYDDE